jgi:hypothetical protein
MDTDAIHSSKRSGMVLMAAVVEMVCGLMRARDEKSTYVYARDPQALGHFHFPSL